MKSVLKLLRRKLLGETWTIPLGVCATLAVALVARDLLPDSDWQSVGGFALAALLVATWASALFTHRPRHQRGAPTEHHEPITRSDQ